MEKNMVTLSKIVEGLEMVDDIIGRKSYIPVSDVIDELDDCLKRVVQLLG